MNNFKYYYFSYHIIMNKNLFTYKKSGVDIKAADKFVKFISKISTKKEAKKSLIILVVLDQ